ncbi:M48 family metallopeptidase [Streptomyces sp. CC219B]|uniref:M48 family metallopeptidase n=1 Tax=Streptomyces sp. CC219B TaxID=3044574 RepID=UPI0024A968A9|nr:M48 family metallopeptidase [Streptomyces sp. CC219B]
MGTYASGERRRSAAVREWLLVVAMIVTAWWPAVAVGVPAVLYLAPGHDWGFALVALPMLFAARAVAAGREPPPGHAVRPDDEPELATLVREVARRLGFRAPLLVRVVPEPVAAVAAFRVEGARTHVMLLGMPFLRSLTEAQLAAVIAHELSHAGRGRDRRAEWLDRSRTLLDDRLDGYLRPLFAPLAVPLLRASQPAVWRAEAAADAAAARVAGTAATAEALTRTGLIQAAYDGLGVRWLLALAEDGAYPEDFYDALDTALSDPHVADAMARYAAEQESLDPYGAAGHPPADVRVAALPDVVPSVASVFRDVPLRTERGAAYERWCVERLGDPEGPAPREDAEPRPERLLDLDPERLRTLVDAALDGPGPLPLLVVTGEPTPARAVSAALDAVADGGRSRLARQLEPGLRRMPSGIRPTVEGEVLAGAMSVPLVALLREAGWTHPVRWLSGVMAAPDGTTVDLHDLLTRALDSGDQAPVRALLTAAGTKEVSL